MAPKHAGSPHPSTSPPRTSLEVDEPTMDVRSSHPIIISLAPPRSARTGHLTSAVQYRKCGHAMWEEPPLRARNIPFPLVKMRNKQNRVVCVCDVLSIASKISNRA